MKILQVTTPGEFIILDVPIPLPGPHEVLTRVTAVTTCPQWDLHLRHNEPMFVGHKFHYPYTPGQPGHEATGTVEAVGAEVTRFVPGDRVSAWRDQGHHVPGCYAQFVVHKEENLIKVPDGLPDMALASVELAMCMGTVFRMLREMNAVKRRRVGIAGLGPAGLLAVQMAKVEGAEAIFGFDLLADRRALACRLGAAACFDPSADLEDQFPSCSAQARLETSVDCVGAKNSAEFLMDRTSDVVALFGVQRENYNYAVRHAGLTLAGYKGHGRESADYAVELIRDGKLDLSALVTHCLPLERYNEGIDLLEARKALKICFLPWESSSGKPS